MEGQHHAHLQPAHPLDAERPAAHLGLGRPAEVEHGGWRLAVAVLPVAHEAPHLRRVAAERQGSVLPQAGPHVGHVVAGQHLRHGDLELGVEAAQVERALGLGHGLFEELHVGVEAHGLDVAVLLVAQHGARAPQLHVGPRDGEARAQLGVLLEHPQAPHRLVGQRHLVGHQEVAVATHAGATDPSA